MSESTPSVAGSVPPWVVHQNAVVDWFTRTIAERALLHHTVARVPVVGAGFGTLEPVASLRDGDLRIVAIELPLGAALIEWSGETGLVRVATCSPTSTQAALWRLRRRLGDARETSADMGGGGLALGDWWA